MFLNATSFQNVSDHESSEIPSLYYVRILHYLSQDSEVVSCFPLCGLELSFLSFRLIPTQDFLLH